MIAGCYILSLRDGKRSHSQTSSSSSLTHSQSHDQEVDPVDNYELDPIEYYDQLPPIHEASNEFKQTKGMFKCLGHFLSNLGKNKKKIPEPFTAKAETLWCANPPPLPTLKQIASLPLTDHMEVEPFLPPTNLTSRSGRFSAFLESFMTREQIVEELNQLHDLSNNIETTLQNA
ncbi:hypothetical protein Tco_0617026 [Tanacetum coccineum]